MSSYVFKSIIGNIELVSSKNRIIAVHRTRKKPNKTEDKLLKRSALQVKMYLARKGNPLIFQQDKWAQDFKTVFGIIYKGYLMVEQQHTAILRRN